MLMAKLKVNKPLHEKWNSLISKLETGDLCVKKNEKKKEKKKKNLKKKKKLQWDIISHQSEWPLSKKLETIGAGEGVEKREHSCTVGGNINWFSHYGEQYGGSLKD